MCIRDRPDNHLEPHRVASSLRVEDFHRRSDAHSFAWCAGYFCIEALMCRSDGWSASPIACSCLLTSVQLDLRYRLSTCPQNSINPVGSSRTKYRNGWSISTNSGMRTAVVPMPILVTAAARVPSLSTSITASCLNNVNSQQLSLEVMRVKLSSRPAKNIRGQAL